MTSPADASQRDAGFARITKAALGAVALIMLVEFVLPGFLLAGLSKAYMSGYRPSPAAARVENAILAPAAWLMLHSAPIRGFYMWEYRLAGGRIMGVGTTGQGRP